MVLLCIGDVQADELDVATRWYRAPEIMMSNRRYTTASKSTSMLQGLT